jgi:adenylosuccinate lyase
MISHNNILLLQPRKALRFMVFSRLTAISPIDGRYGDKVEELQEYYSEWAFMKYRVRVEIEYFIFLCGLLPQLKTLNICDKEKELRDIYRNFTVDDAVRIKAIEAVTNHDVKAVEYFVKEKFDALSLADYKEFIHFGLTSQDINNTSIPLIIKESLEKIYYSEIEGILNIMYK